MRYDKPLTALMDNVFAMQMGEAAKATMSPDQKAGDSIDRGLILLRLLNEKGFDVVPRNPS